MSSFPSPVPRREFLSQLAATGAVLAAAGACAPAMQGAAAPAPSRLKLPPASQDGPWDNSWLEKLAAAKHKQVFDAPSFQDGGALYYAKNFLNAHRDAYGRVAPEVQVVMGIHGDAAPIVFGDALWQKYEWGKQSKAKDPRTGTSATRNIFWHPKEGEEMYDYSVNALQERGTTFLFCNNVMRFLVRTIADKHGGSYESVRAELVGGLLPGVTVVPAMVAAIGLAQDGGCSYVYAGGS